MIPAITIASYEEAESLLGEVTYLHVISINSPGWPPPVMLKEHTGQTLILSFDDVIEVRRQSCYKVPSKDDVRKIIDFGQGIGPGDPTLIHCAAGISRSSAAALSILASKVSRTPEGALEAFISLLQAKQAIRPNIRMVAFADSLLKFNGALIRRYERIFDANTNEVRLPW
jgi:predicted protein tyrosine phosphatase